MTAPASAPTEERYLELVQKVRAHNLPPDVVADIEAYRAACELNAYELAAAVAATATSYEQIMRLCPYGRT